MSAFRIGPSVFDYTAIFVGCCVVAVGSGFVIKKIASAALNQAQKNIPKNEKWGDGKVKKVGYLIGLLGTIAVCALAINILSKTTFRL